MLPNDMGRCMGYLNVNNDPLVCDKRETCARYVELNTGGPRTIQYEYLCLDLDEYDLYIPAEKPNEN